MTDDVAALTKTLITELNARLKSLNQIQVELIKAYYASDKSAQIFNQYQETSISKLRSIIKTSILLDEDMENPLRELQSDLERDEQVIQALTLPKDKEALKQQALTQTRALIQTLGRIQQPAVSPVPASGDGEGEGIPVPHKPAR